MIPRLLFRILFLGLAIAIPPAAAETLPGPIAANVVRVLDGDTVVVRARIWLGQDVETAVRVLGVDTPETGPRAKCDSERQVGEAAKQFTRAALPPGAVVRLTGVKPDKYGGRVLAHVALPDGQDLAQALIAAGLARAYDGRARGGWCQA